MLRVALALSFLVLVLAPQALAQAKPDVRFLPITEIDFLKDVDVQGQLVRPGASLVTEPVRQRFHPLIRLRRDFRSEMRRSLVEVP